MAILDASMVRLGVPSTTKEEAIQIAGNLLVAGNRVAPSYVKGMLAREQTMSTYIGNGVSIPHGQFDDKDSIFQTGISVVQFPDGVVWNEDETAYLVFGIAATNDEHIDILTNLAEVLEDPDDAMRLAHASSAEEIIDALSQSPQEA